MKSLSKPGNKKSDSISDLDFELPVDPGFISKTHPMSAEEMLRHNQWIVEQFNSSPEAKEKWARNKCDVEFVL